MSPAGLKSPVTPIWRGYRPRTFASGVLSPLGPWIAATGRRQRTPPFRPPGPSPGGSEVCRWPRCGAPQRPALGLRGRAVGAAAHARSATCMQLSAGRPAADCTTPRRCKVAGADGSATNEMPSERAGQPRPGAARTRRGTRGASQGNLRARLRHCGFSPSPSCRSSRLPRRWTRRRPHQTLRSAADGARWEQQVRVPLCLAPLPSPPLLLLLLSPPPPPPSLLSFSSSWFSSCRLHFPASCNSRLLHPCTTFLGGNQLLAPTSRCTALDVIRGVGAEAPGAVGTLLPAYVSLRRARARRA